MAIRYIRALIALMMMAGLILMSRPQLACGPFLERAVFTYSVHPDLPLERFAAGNLGVLQPTYARSYLAVAYRHIMGVGYDQEEQKAIVSVWNERLKPYWEIGASDWVKVWLDARNSVISEGAPSDIDVFRTDDRRDYYLNYVNCPQDAFRSAAATLNRMVERFGASSSEVREWVQAQDQVFVNCSGRPESIPDAARPSDPPLARAEREYQIAAAHFYAGSFEAAETVFNRIAGNDASPWKPIALYLAARTLVRKGTLSGKYGESDASTLAQAEARLKKILADPGQSSLHPAAARLMSFVKFRLNPEERLKELAASLLRKSAGRTIKQDLWDYTKLLDRYVNDEEEERKYESLPKVGRDNDMTDWVLTFQVTDRAAMEYALRKWEETRSLPWLVSAISKVDTSNPKASALVDAAGKIDQSSPASATLSYHSLRLMLESGRIDEARHRLDGLLSTGRASMPPSSLNLFLSLRMKVSRNLDEFLKYAQRPAVAITYDMDGRELPEDSNENKDNKLVSDAAKGLMLFGYDSARILNEKMPLDVLRQAATSSLLPAHLQREIAMSAWVRSVLLDDEKSGLEIVPALLKLIPEMSDTLKAYQTAQTKDERKFAAIYLILKFPGVEPSVDAGVYRQTPISEIDNYRDNWWCALAEPAHDGGRGNDDSASGDSLAFLTAAQRTAITAEWNSLKAIDTAPNYLCSQTVRLVNLRPDDPRAPEALHLAVRSTRYGCTNNDTGRFSKQAYDLLHRRYPKSSWAAKTRYWFK